MEEKLNEMLDDLTEMRSQAFKTQDEEVYKLLGKAMAVLMEARALFRRKVKAAK